MNEDYYVDEYKGGWAVWHHKSAFPWQLPVTVSFKSAADAIDKYHRYIATPYSNLKRTNFTSEDWT